VNVLKFGQHGDRIETEILGISSHDAARVRQCGQIAEFFAFQRDQIMATDPRRALSFTKRDALVGTRVPQ
jgi:hypothetical protein